jgi:hypothetical protein
MSALVATIVDTKALLDTVAGSLIAGVGVTAAFSFAILGAALFGEARRDGRTVAAVGAGGLAVVALAGCAAAIVFGIVVMTSK